MVEPLEKDRNADEVGDQAETRDHDPDHYNIGVFRSHFFRL
jgi:hypothetical protein